MAAAARCQLEMAVFGMFIYIFGSVCEVHLSVAIVGCVLVLFL